MADYFYCMSALVFNSWEYAGDTGCPCPLCHLYNEENQ